MQGVLVEVLDAFGLLVAPSAVQPVTGGLINDTFKVEVAGQTLILQRMNTDVFKDPHAVQANIQKVARHLLTKPGMAGKVPDLLPTKTGALVFRSSTGQHWRLMTYIAGSKAIHEVTSAAEAREAGRILGQFHVMLADFDPQGLQVVLPGFHDTEAYFQAFEFALAEDRHQRKQRVAPADLHYLLGCQPYASLLAREVADGRLQKRVCHGDTKISNFLFAVNQSVGLCLIDLDTVMSGLWHYDVGDLLRSVCTPLDPNAPPRLEWITAVRAGYLAVAETALTAREKELLPLSAILIAFELTVRFLTDYLAGDTYFKVTSPDENLHRAKRQLGLLKELEKSIKT